MSWSRSRSGFALAATASLLFSAFGAAGVRAYAAPASPGAAADHLVVNEVYGGGGNSGAPYKNDFVELYNPTDEPIDLTGWKINYYSASGGSGGSCALTGSVQPSGFYLAQQNGGATGAALPTPDVTCTLNLSGTSGAVELLDGTGALIDRVGYGSANRFEGAATPALDNTKAVYRTTAGVDTDNNAADFTVGAPNPQNSGGGTTTPTPTASPTPTTPAAVRTIAEVQGTGAKSPLVDQTVTVRGVVTANYPTGGFNGFYLQTPGSGGTPKAAGDASDGLFAYGDTSVEPGRCYDVTGKVTEYPTTQADGYKTLTELTGITLTAVEGCDPVRPTPLASLPATDAEKEAYEGMSVLPQGTWTITNNYQLNQFGQLGLAFGDKPLYTPTDRVPYPEAAAFEAEQAKKYITLDDGSSWDYMSNKTAQASPLPYLSQSTPMRTNSQLTFKKPVILDYRFQWNFQPTGQVVGSDDTAIPVTGVNDRPTAPPAVGGELKVAAFNILNYFTDLGEQESAIAKCNAYTDREGKPVTAKDCQVRGAWTPAAFADQQAKIVGAINGSGADVIALMEVENSAGLSWIKRDRDYTVNALVAALNSKGGTWAAVPSPPVTPSNEDVIRTAFIYNKDAATPVGASQMLIDPVFSNARQPLAQEFKSSKSALGFVAIANHFKSKSSGPDDGTGQGLSNAARKQQATALTGWADSTFAGKPVLLLGDFNAYSKEEPLQILEAAGYQNVVDLEGTTYAFSGRLGSLDHIFANAAAKALVSGSGVWRINADEAIAMQYSRRNYNVTDFFTSGPYASSDHNPPMIGLKAAGATPTPTPSPTPSPTPTPTPTPKPDSPITVKWNSLGGVNGPVGVPVGPESCGLRDGGCQRHFTGGSLYDSNSTQAQLVKGAIRDKWARMGWETGRLGYPVSDEQCGLRDGGCVQFFQGGLMYWSTDSGAYPVWGAIAVGYGKVGWEGGPLGYPVGEEICGLRDGGCTQRFQGGLMAWSEATGAHPVWGAISMRYAEMGWERGQLGYPIGGEFCGLRDGGCGQFFQGGSLYWSPASGVWPSWGAVRDHWARNGWEAGRYGYPVGFESCAANAGITECRQPYQGGMITWNATRGAN